MESERVSHGQTKRVVAVTGASGLIGKRVVELLRLQEDVSLRILARHENTLTADLETVQGDVLSAASLRELLRGASHVVHLAGVAHTDLRSEEVREHARQINVQGTQNVLDCALTSGVERVVVASSAHVYAGQQGVDLREDSAVAGDGGYASMKLAVEDAVDEAALRGLSAVIVRPCLTYGPGVKFNLAALMRAVRGGYYFHVRGADPWRSFASVDTVAAATVHLLLACAEGRYNIADRTPVRLREWVDDLADRMEVRRPRVLPGELMSSLAAVGTGASSLGLPSPLTRQSFRKLTVSFTLDVSKLAATGFVWPETQDEVLAAMVQAEAAK